MKDVDPGEYGAAWPKLGANFRPSRIPVEQQRVDPHYFAIQMKSFPIYTKVYDNGLCIIAVIIGIPINQPVFSGMSAKGCDPHHSVRPVDRKLP